MNLPKKIFKVLRLTLRKKTAALHEPLFKNNESKLLVNCINSGYVSSIGKYVTKFEDKVKKYTNSKNVVSVINGTAALHLALKLLNVKKNDEVILPTITFVATANAISYCDAIPHFVDSELDTFGIDVFKLEKYLSKNCKIINGECFNKNTKRRIRAIIAVHIFGNPMNIKGLVKIAKKFKLKIIEDAAEGLGSYYKNIHVGNFGDIGIISFNGNKVITTGGGGMLLIKSNNIAKKAKHLATSAKKLHKWEYFHDQIGFNYRLPNINAALGYAQITNIKKLIVAKKKLYCAYKKNFSKIKEIKFINPNPFTKSNHWLNTIYLHKSNIFKRNQVLKELHQNRYYCRPIWTPLHKLPMYKNFPKDNLSNAVTIQKSVINIPSSSHFFYPKSK
jgi:perosamine synthetase